MHKILIILVCIITLTACDSALNFYAIVTKDGVIMRKIDSKVDCERIIERFKIDGICIVNN